ncbi:MAG: arginine--tRNA ligase, partial [candidate division SR1 bacterium]
QDSEKRIIFDKEKALSFAGETGPYLQYTYARCASILKKSCHSEGNEESSIDYSLLSNDEEKAILIHLAQLEKTVQKSANEYKPNYIARYVLELAKLFNSYYQKHKIIQEDPTQKPLEHARLALVKATQQVIANTCDLLGIEVVEEM